MRVFANQADTNDQLIVKAPKDKCMDVKESNLEVLSQLNNTEANFIPQAFPETKISQAFNFWQKGKSHRHYTYTQRLVTDYFDGIRATDYLPKIDNMDQLAKVILLIAQALIDLHEKGIIHSDVKSDNILISESKVNGTMVVRFIDFGLSRKIVPLSSTPPLYQCAEVNHCAPELEFNKRIFPHPNQDFYSFAYCLLNEVLSTHSLADDLIHAYPSILEFIRLSLNSDPTQRPQSLQSFCEQLGSRYQPSGSL